MTGHSGRSGRAGRARDGGPEWAGPGAQLGPLLARDLLVLFVGINPSLYSVEAGHHFARPGNRFWATMHAAGFTPRRLRPDQDHELLLHDVGLTNIATRPTRAAAELSRQELEQGAAALELTVQECRPQLVAIAGLVAYRTAFGRPRAVLGLQPDAISGRPVWVLPNPSGLNAHYKPADYARLYAEARRYAESRRQAVDLPESARLGIEDEAADLIAGRELRT